MSDLDSIWAEMKAGDSSDRKEAKMRSMVLGGGSMVGVTKLMKEKNIPGYAAGSTKALKAKKRPSPAATVTSAEVGDSDGSKDSILYIQPLPRKSQSSPATIISSVVRDATACETGSSMERRRALQSMLTTLRAAGDTFCGSDYSDLFVEICKPLFKRFSDDVEKCREHSFSITELMFERSSNVLPVLAYFLPALMKRIPPIGAYDDDLKIFVTDIEAHEAFKRGRAVDRQDRGDALRTHIIVETSEEIRLSAVRCVASLVNKIISSDACSVLQPYFTEIVLFLQSQLRDPFGDIRTVSCSVLGLLALQPEFELGMKFYAVALVRAMLPVMRHRHAKVRCAAVDAIRLCVMVPDRAKRKGAGTAAIHDLVGFHEENVLPVAAFYKAEVQINYMAEIVGDATVAVRERVAMMLTAFLTELEDRYDHQTRLLPYLLDLLTDDVDSVSGIALACLQTCGRQYEQDHQDEIIERRQYGVDGDNRMNLDKPLPPPFTRRPRLGVRLFVRGNTKRFLVALLNELTNWISKTRLKSCKLLKVVVCLVEEHLAMESYAVLPMFVKALGFATADKDAELRALLLETVELLGRFMSPDIYIHFILPRLTGDVEVVQFGVDAATRISVLEVLQQLVSGTKPSQLPQHLPALVAAIVDPLVIDPGSLALRSAGLDLMLILLQAVAGGVNAAATVSAVEAHFMQTGRLSSLQKTIRSMFCRLVTDLSEPALQLRASDALVLLASLEGGKSDAMSDKDSRLQYLFAHHTCPVLQSLLGESGGFEYFQSTEYPDWLNTDANTISLLLRLIESPWHCMQSDEAALSKVTRHLCGAVWGASLLGGIQGTRNSYSQADKNILHLLVNAAITTMQPIAAFAAERFEEIPVPSAYKFLVSGPLQLSQELLERAVKFCTTAGTESSLDPRTAKLSLASMILDSFVTNSMWMVPHGGTVTGMDKAPESVFDLQRKRIFLVSLLLGIKDDVFMDINDTAIRLSPLPDATIISTSKCILAKDTDRFLFHDAAMLIESVASRALAPDCPFDVRFRGLQLLDRIVFCLVGSPGQRKLEPFNQRSQAIVISSSMNISPQKISAMLNNDVDVACDALGQSKAMFPGPVVIPLLLSALDDSSDAIRSGAVYSLCSALHFLIPDDSASTAADCVGFSIVCTSLIRHMTRAILMKMTVDTDGKDEFEDLMGFLLRSVACLNPIQFEVLTRNELQRLLDGEYADELSGHRDTAVSLFSDLINHCDILVQFTEMK